MHKICIMMLSALVLTGCLQVEGEVAEESKNKNIFCKDTRDGETFMFNTDNVTNAKIGADACFDVIDYAGKKRNLCKSHEIFLKCEEV